MRTGSAQPARHGSRRCRAGRGTGSPGTRPLRFAGARSEAAGRVVRVTHAIITVEGMLSRWLGRRMPLDPARLFALTAEPGRELPHALTVIHQELGELELPEGRVVTCDPHEPGVPLARRVPPRSCPAQL